MSYTTHNTVRWQGEDARRFRADFNRGSKLGRAADGQLIVIYDTELYPFDRHIRRLLVNKGLVPESHLAQIPSLEKLHDILPPALTALDDGELNEVSRQFYDTDTEFVSAYEAFLRDFAGPQIVKGDFVFQSTPTIRFHFPHQTGFNWRPRFHTDIMLGHPPQELNLWLPVCGASGHASMLIADLTASIGELDKLGLDFSRLAGEVQTDEVLAARCHAISHSVDLPYGQVLAFDPRCLHATQYNDTDHTRISFDFRVLPLDDYEAMSLEYRGTGRRQMLFRRGHYFDQRTSREL